MKTERVQFVLEKELKKELEHLAWQNKVSASEMCRRIIKNEIERSWHEKI